MGWNWWSKPCKSCNLKVDGSDYPTWYLFPWVDTYWNHRPYDRWMGHWARWDRRWLYTDAFLHSRGDDLGVLLPFETTQGSPENWEDWSCEDGINQVRSLLLFGSFPQDFLAKLRVFSELLNHPCFIIAICWTWTRMNSLSCEFTFHQIGLEEPTDKCWDSPKFIVFISFLRRIIRWRFRQIGRKSSDKIINICSSDVVGFYHHLHKTSNFETGVFLCGPQSQPNKT
jgi:hypothetical protein